MVEFEVGLVCTLVEAQQQGPLDVCSVQALLRADLMLCSGALATVALQPEGGRNKTIYHVTDQSQ